MKNSKEWFRQAEYDLKTVDVMFHGRRYIYAIFMCHLALEKALKGLYVIRFKELAPKTHNLIYLAEKINLTIPAPMYNSLFTLNRVSVPTRYPEDLQKMVKSYSKAKTMRVLKESEKILQWLKKQL